jgi:glycosyltransferase involved in cell wall biosynthesis/Tfp pilus assembly protein PilF
MLTWFRRRTANFETESRIAEEALNRGDFEQASIAYENIAKKWPNVAFVRSRRGRALMELGRQDEAIGEFEQALELDPSEPEALFNRGIIAQRSGAESEARSFFERAFASRYPHPEAGLKLAAAAVAEGSPATALELYRRVLDIDPTIAEAQYGYGEAAMLLGRDRDALHAFQRAAVIRPVLAEATAIFERLFQTSVQRRPRSARPLICIPIVAAYYQNWLGGQTYLINFVRIMSAVPKGQRPRFIVVVHCDEQERMHSVLDAISGNDAVIGITDSKGELILSKPVLERMKRHRNKSASLTRFVLEDLMTMVDWTFPLLYPLWRVPALPGPLFWIPDLQHRFWPSFFSAEEVAGRDRDMKALAARAAPIIFSSLSAQRDFGDHFQNQRCRTHVWRFVSSPTHDSQGADDRYQALDLPARFYYTPNQYWRHKDHTTLFRALRRILDQGHDLTFVCTGTDLQTATDEYSRELLLLIETLSLGRHLRLLGVLPRSDQIEVMRHSCAIIQPSLFEGWSTVVEDARAIGRPIIASDIPVHREQLGENATYFAPHDAKSLAAAVTALDSTLLPGPAPEQEAAALANLKQRTEASAQQFLAILKHEAALRA